MTKYLLIDLANMFFRARHAAFRGASAEEKMAFALHVVIASVNKCWRDQKADHVIFCLEGRSWRKSFYAPYKANRAVARAASTEAEQEEETLFWETFESLQNFVHARTNCTVLQHAELEADDLVAGWIQSHPNDKHVIISSDTDFYQLLAENVEQYNGITDELHTLTGIYDKKRKLVIDKKTKLPKVIPDPQFILFEKCMRGDPTDNIFSAFPGVRTKGSAKKVGLIEGFADRNKKGFAWNNLMLQRWADHNGDEHRVLDDYNRNCILVDLTMQPTDIKEKIVDTIITNSVPKSHPMIGAQFLKFCGRYDLVKLSEQAQTYAVWLGAAYPEKA